MPQKANISPVLYLFSLKIIAIMCYNIDIKFLVKGRYTMNKKSLFVIMSALIVSCIFFSCDSLWNVQDNNTSSLALQLDLQNIIPPNATRNTVARTINGNDNVMQINATIYNAKTNAIIKTVSENINKNEIDTISITIDKLRTNQEVYATIEITHNPYSLVIEEDLSNNIFAYEGKLDTTYFKSISDSIMLKKGENILVTHPQVVFVLPSTENIQEAMSRIQYHNEGNDNNKGYTPDNPLTTLDEAYNKLKGNNTTLPKGATIYVMDVLSYNYDEDNSQSPTFTLNYPGATIKRFASQSGMPDWAPSFISVTGSTLILQDVTIDGNKGSFSSASPLVDVGPHYDYSIGSIRGSLILEKNAVLQNNAVKALDEYASAYSAIILNESEVTFKGGSVTNNDGKAAIGMLDESSIILESGLINVSGNTSTGKSSDIAISPDVDGNDGEKIILTGTIDEASRIGINPALSGIPSTDAVLVEADPVNEVTINSKNFFLNGGGTTKLSSDKKQLLYVLPTNIDTIVMDEVFDFDITGNNDIVTFDYTGGTIYYNRVLQDGEDSNTIIQTILSRLENYSFPKPEGVENISVSHNSGILEYYYITFEAKEGYYFYNVDNDSYSNEYEVLLGIGVYENTYYVDGSKAEYGADGSINNPYPHAQSAINQILEGNDGKTEFTIRIIGDSNAHKASLDDQYDSSNHAGYVDDGLLEIDGGDKDLKVRIEAYNGQASLSALIFPADTKGRRVLYVAKKGTGNVQVTLGSDLTLTRGGTLWTNPEATPPTPPVSDNATLNGAGVFVTGGATLILDGATISGNIAAERGGGVYLEKGSTLDLRSGSITGNTALDPTVAGGGGVYTDNASTITGDTGLVTGNTGGDIEAD